MPNKPWRQAIIAHARHPELAEQVKKLLEYAGFVPVVADDPSAAGGLSGMAASIVFDARRSIVLARRGVEMSEGLRGAVLLRFSGEILDGDATFALLAAINELNRRPMTDSIPGGSASGE